MGKESPFVFLIWYEHMEDLADAYQAGLKNVQQKQYVQQDFPFTMLILKPDLILHMWKLSMDHPHAPLSQLSW